MRNHRKVKALRNKFDKPGAPVGYAFWSMFLEYLTGLDGNEMQYNDLECEMFAAELGISGETIKEIIEFCIKIELLFNKNGFIHSISLDEELLPVYKKRNKAKEASAARRRQDNGSYSNKTNSIGESDNTKSKSLGIVSTEKGEPATTKPQSRVEYSRVEESRVEEIAPVFVDAKNFFYGWFEEKEKKTCNFDVADNVSLHRIIKNLENRFVEPTKILSEFKKIFENWDSWGQLYQDKLKFTQIEYYWPKIVESVQAKDNLSIAESFELFWKAYDKNVGRLNCEKLWMHLTNEQRNAVLDYTPKYVLSQPEKKYRLDPENFLEREKWHDEIISGDHNPSQNGHQTKKQRKIDIDAVVHAPKNAPKLNTD